MNMEVTAKNLLEQLEKDNWEVSIEDDYPDFKHFCSIKKDGILGAFKRLDIILISLDKNNDKAEVRFVFYADPKAIGANKRKFGKKDRESNFEALKNVCRGFFKNAGIQMQEYGASMSPKSKHVMTFGDEKYVRAAYEAELIYYNYQNIEQ